MIHQLLFGRNLNFDGGIGIYITHAEKQNFSTALNLLPLKSQWKKNKQTNKKIAGYSVKYLGVKAEKDLLKR